MNNWEIRQSVDLANPVDTPVPAFALASVGDKSAHTWYVEVFSHGAPANISGASVVGYFARPDGAVVVIEGSITGNTATVTMTQECYAIAGTVKGIVRLNKIANQTLTMVTARITVGPIDMCQVIDPGDAIPNIDDLIAMATYVIRVTEDAEKATSKANTAAGSANAAAGNANTAAGAANQAAAAIANMTVEAHGLSPTHNPTATITDVNNHKHIDFGIVKGDPGDGLVVLARYDTIGDLRAAHPTGAEGDVYTIGDPEQPPMMLWFWNVDISDWDILGTLAGDIFPINGIYPGVDGYVVTAGDIPTESGSNVQDAVFAATAIANRIYQGVDLSVTFATEIAAAPYSGNVWAWIKARIQAANFTGINVGDYIPFTANAKLVKAEVDARKQRTIARFSRSPAPPPPVPCLSCVLAAVMCAQARAVPVAALATRLCVFVISPGRKCIPYCLPPCAPR